MKLYTIIAFAENQPGVMYRMTELFMKRKLNIESLTASETDEEGISRITFTLKATETVIEKVVKQLYRIIEVTKVYENEEQDIIAKELALVKVSASAPQKRKEIENIANLTNSKILLVLAKYIILEKTGSEEEISSLLILLKSYGIKEFVRSGRIALKK